MDRIKRKKVDERDHLMNCLDKYAEGRYTKYIAIESGL